MIWLGDGIARTKKTGDGNRGDGLRRPRLPLGLTRVEILWKKYIT